MRDAGMTVHAVTINRWCEDMHEKMCGSEASKCCGKVPPSHIGLSGMFLHSGQRKISLGGNYWAINSDRPLGSMVHDSPFLEFFRLLIQKTCLVHDLALLRAHGLYRPVK